MDTTQSVDSTGGSMSFKSPEERRFEGKALRDHRAFVKAVREGAGR